jgi:hypothetical protein
MADQQPGRQSRRVRDTIGRQQERARQREEEQANARAETIARARVQPGQQDLETEIRRLVNRIYHRNDLQHQVERMSDGHLGFLRVIDTTQKIAELKRAQPPRSKIEEISEIVRVILLIKKTALEERQATNTYDNYRFQYNGHRRPVLGRSTGEERRLLQAAQQDYDRIMMEAHDASVRAARELDNLNMRFNEMIDFGAPPEIIYPGTDDEDEEAFDAEEALEVHRKAAEVGSEALEKLLKALNNPKKDSDYPEPITEYVKEKFEEFIDVYPQYNSNTKREMKKDSGRVLKKFQSARETVSKPIHRKIIGNIVDFVMEQPDDFRDSFISSYVHECANAYPRAQGDARLSCVNGILERFYLGLAHYLSTICPGTKEKPCPKIYRRINKALNKVAYEDNNELKNEFIQEWDEKHMNEHNNQEARKKSFIDFMQHKYKELYGEDELEEATIKMIDDLAKQYDYAFKSGQFGGSNNIRRKRTTKRSIKKQRKTRKHKK